MNKKVTALLLALLLCTGLTAPALAGGNAAPDEIGALEIAYAPILEQYLTFVKDYYYNGGSGGSDALWCIMGDALAYNRAEDYGYFFRDIDGNGVFELLITAETAINAIFTIADGKPLLLGSYYTRNDCLLDEEGNIYNRASSGAANFGTAIYNISADGRGLTLIESAWVETNAAGDVAFFRTIGGVTQAITEIDFRAWNEWANSKTYLNESMPFIAILDYRPANAAPTSSTVFVDGAPVAFDAYHIGGNNYFKLRDLAFTLSGTRAQFSVRYDESAAAIYLEKGQAYTPIGGEMADKGTSGKIPTPTTAKIFLDGRQVSFTAYNIDGYNYFKLRDIGRAFDFDVTWAAASNEVFIDTGKGYTED